MEMIGYHGTSAENETSIIQNNFFVSSKSDEWLGTGAYFFIEGLSDPAQCAESWAKVSSYDKVKRVSKYSDYVVLQADLNFSLVCNLDDDEDLKAFAHYREKFFNKIESENLSASRNDKKNDCKICNMILNETNIDAIIRKEYIKLDAEQRRKHHNSRIPNCKIVNVKDPNKTVSNIKTVQKGRV